MCGIFGYIGDGDSVKICLDGLKLLEYRGYDSAGIAGILNGEMHCYKEIGTISNLEKILEKRMSPMNLAIAHTRWATHGKPSQINAHPHFDHSGAIAIVHNGILENHHALREMLKKQGVHFQTETDSEVIAQLIAHFYEGDFLAAVQHALSLMQGFWGIAAIHKNHPDQIIATAKENPIAIGLSSRFKESFVASDFHAFHRNDLDIYFLKDDEIAVIGKGAIEIFDGDLKVNKTPERVELQKQAISKEGYNHFMIKEIFEQAQTIRSSFHGRFIQDFGTAEFESLSLTTKELLAVNRILILGCGTSWHAGCVAALQLEHMARIPTHAEISSEFRYKNPIISEDTLVIAISQSGETLDTLAAVREVKNKGAKVLGICNVANSTLMRESDSSILLRAGPEISVCSTKAFTSQLTVLTLFTLLMARLRHMSKEEGKYLLSEILRLPELVENILLRHEEIAILAKKYAGYEEFFFLGRHYMYITSLEGALKLKEISYLNASGYPAGEMKHGPIALVDKGLATIGMCGNKRTYEKILSNLMEIKARGGPILAFAPQGAKEIDQIADDLFYIPEISDDLASIPYSVAAQLLAYYIALERGTEIDKPRNLAKSVTVE
ncbi:MAG TPA: glutamine--fructose-6-phosphate transaminase (isomerizing) [Rhabdochlamydiaceae bacterium]|nr:glutamine--fructose-6-phosphate transaminase (isomerizing) [Rhabdochlamydiaceae bacterium]